MFLCSIFNLVSVRFVSASMHIFILSYLVTYLFSRFVLLSTHWCLSALNLSICLFLLNYVFAHSVHPSFYSLVPVCLKSIYLPLSVELCICPFCPSMHLPVRSSVYYRLLCYFVFFFISFMHYHALVSSVWTLFVRGLCSLLDRGIVTLFLLHLFCLLFENIFIH